MSFRLSRIAVQLNYTFLIVEEKNFEIALASIKWRHSIFLFFMFKDNLCMYNNDPNVSLLPTFCSCVWQSMISFFCLATVSKRRSFLDSLLLQFVVVFFSRCTFVRKYCHLLNFYFTYFVPTFSSWCCNLLT